jgi:hypothetical protein
MKKKAGKIIKGMKTCLLKEPGLKEMLFLISLVFFFSFDYSKAGPPFFTDDPDPVPYHHWEYYLASQNAFDIRNRSATGTLPLIEINWGAVKNVQIHIVLPAIYLFNGSGEMLYSYTYTELGVKYRFIKETEKIPEIGIFPIVEIPVVRDPRFDRQDMQLYLPVWIQKSWNKLTIYGGAGYWINPGIGNQNWVFTGGEVQYGFTDFLTLGAEAYFHTPPAPGEPSVAGVSMGGFLNFSRCFHFIFSLGHTLTGENQLTSYAGLYITL